MNTYDFVHLALLAIGGRVHGKTKLQKTVYFLGKLTGRLADLGYHPHFYGPYSPSVSQATDRLLALGFLQEKVASHGGVDSRGFEFARHDYALTGEGEEVAKLKAQRRAALWKRLQTAAATLRKGGDPDYVGLSIAAKTDFVLGRKHGKARVDELAELARSFGWAVSAGQVLKAAHFLRDIGLVELADKQPGGR